MFETHRLSRVTLIGCIAFAFALALWLLALAASQTALPAAALQDLTAIITPTNTPLPKLTVNKNSQLIGDQNSNDFIDPGDTIRYTIRLKNIDNYPADFVEIVDDFDDTLLEKPDKISNDGYIKEGTIVWEIERLDAGQELTVTYDVKVILTFPIGKSIVKNSVAVKIQGVTSITGEKSIEIEFNPTQTPFPTSTLTTTPTLTPTPSYTPFPITPVSANQSAGPTSQAISPTAQALLAFGFILAAMGGLFAFTFLIHNEKKIPTTLRDGYILTLIMGTVIILGLAGSVERSAIAGLIGTVAGYVLRGVVEGGEDKGGEKESEKEGESGK